jgi:outer membrane lipoprotein SlyB
MRRIMSLSIMVILMFMLVRCETYQPTTPRTYQGAGVGAVIGGIAGALLDRHNPWRGGVIGGALGLVAGATLTEISARAAREAAESNHPVEYRTEDERGFYRAEPEGYNPSTRCNKIHERVWQDGQLVKDQIKEVCEGTKYERRY